MEIAEELFQQQAGTKKKNIVHIHFNYDNWGAKSNQSLSTNIKDDQKKCLASNNTYDVQDSPI